MVNSGLGWLDVLEGSSFLEALDSQFFIPLRNEPNIPSETLSLSICASFDWDSLK